MSTRANNSKERILDVSEALMLRKGFASTSIDDIIDKSAITKGGFFYHFNGKLALAHALTKRALIQDSEIFAELFQQADNLTDDPLQQFLIYLKLLADFVNQLDQGSPGCILARFTYENQLFDDELRNLLKQGFINRCEIIQSRLVSVMTNYSINENIEIETLADSYSSIIEGGFILARAYRTNVVLVNQILAYRAYIKLMFKANV